MTIDEIDVMLRSANPVDESDLHEEAADASALFLTIKRRSGLERTADLEPGLARTDAHGVRLGKGVLITGVAFAVGLIVGAVALVAVTTGGDGRAPVATIAPPVAPVIKTPEGARVVVDAFVARYNEGDVNSALAMLAPDATVNTFLSSDVGQLAAEMRWNAAQDSQWHLGECSASPWMPPGSAETASRDAVRLTCSGTFTQNVWVAIGFGSAFPVTHIIVVDSSDRIIRYRLTTGVVSYVGPREAHFYEWVEATHPGDELKIWHEASPLLTNAPPRMTIESATLRNRYADEYASYLHSLWEQPGACEISERGWTSGCVGAP